MSEAMGLLDRLRVRDRAAQEALRAELLPRLTAVCTRLLGDRRIGEETASDVLMDFLTDGVDKLREERAIRSYVRMTAVRRCVRLRGWRTRMETPVDLPDPAGGPEAELSQRQTQDRLQRRLRHCLERLTPRVRRVLRLRFERDMTQERIGEVLGFTKQYAGRFIAAALEGLRRCMEKAA
jgi:RNA polymerase sigma-70 factor, ECF subfamily